MHSHSRRKFLYATLLGTSFLFTSGCGESSAANKTIDVYSPHGKYLEGDIKQRFEAAHPGWTVRFQDMGGGEIFAKIGAERDRPRACVWWGGSASDFKNAEAQGLLEAYVPPWAANLPENAKSPTGGWSATFLTPEIILYNPNKIKAEDVPQEWDGLLDSKWKGRIAVRDARASSGMKLIFGALILREKERHGSIDAGFEFLRKLDANTASYAANPDGLYRLLESDGPCMLAPWNLPDVLNLKKNKGKPFDFVMPKNTMVNVEPIALVKNNPNPEGAKLFYNFVNDPEQLILMAHERDRIPARTDIPQEKLPESMRGLKLEPMKFDAAEFDKNIEEWMARWDSEIKGKGGR